MEEDQNKDVQPQSSEPAEPINSGKPERKGFNIASLICGIIAIVTFCTIYIPIAASILAIIFSVAGKNDAGRGMGIAGLVLGIIVLVLEILVIGLSIAGAMAVLPFLSDYANVIINNTVIY